MAKHLLFDCETLGLVKSTVFGLVLYDGGILKENLAWCTTLTITVGLWTFTGVRNKY